jgi:hypothetical protein
MDMEHLRTLRNETGSIVFYETLDGLSSSERAAYNRFVAEWDQFIGMAKRDADRLFARIEAGTGTTDLDEQASHRARARSHTLEGLQVPPRVSRVRASVLALAVAVCVGLEQREPEALKSLVALLNSASSLLLPRAPGSRAPQPATVCACVIA